MRQGHGDWREPSKAGPTHPHALVRQNPAWIPWILSSFSAPHWSGAFEPARTSSRFPEDLPLESSWPGSVGTGESGREGASCTTAEQKSVGLGPGPRGQGHTGSVPQHPLQGRLQHVIDASRDRLQMHLHSAAPLTLWFIMSPPNTSSR